MKLRNIMLLISIGVALNACTTTTNTIEPVALLSGTTSATFFYGPIKNPHNQRQVMVELLTPIMARAAWTKESYISKGGFWIRYPDGRMFYFPHGFSFFREHGVPGSFVIRQEDQIEYRRLLDEMEK